MNSSKTQWKGTQLQLFQTPTLYQGEDIIDATWNNVFKFFKMIANHLGEPMSKFDLKNGNVYHSKIIPANRGQKKNEPE